MSVTLNVGSNNINANNTEQLKEALTAEFNSIIQNPSGAGSLRVAQVSVNGGSASVQIRFYPPTGAALRTALQAVLNNPNSPFYITSPVVSLADPQPQSSDPPAPPLASNGNSNNNWKIIVGVVVGVVGAVIVVGLLYAIIKKCGDGGSGGGGGGNMAMETRS